MNNDGNRTNHQTVSDASSARIDRELHELYERIPVPDLSFDVTHARESTHTRRWRSPFGRLLTRRVAFAGAAAAAAAAAIIGFALWSAASGSSAVTTANAQIILQRTSATAHVDAAPSGAPYHIVARQTTSAGKGDGWTETWFQDATHFRTQQWLSGDRQGPPTFGEARDGSDFWLWTSSDGATRAVHGSGHALGMPNGLQDDLTGDAPSLPQLLDRFANGGCFQVQRSGTATVLNRAAVVLKVQPTTSSCNPMVKNPLFGLGTSGTATIWVDEQTFLPLRMRMVDGSGRVLLTYDVTEVAVGPDAPSADLPYQAPAGVTIVEVTGPRAAKIALGPQGAGSK